MIGRRQPTDPETAALIRARLDHLLAENAPRRHVPEETDEAAPEDDPTPSADPLRGRRSLPEGRLDALTQRFGRWHVTVVALLLVAGIALAGWTVLRARPVALASAPPVATEPAAPPSGGGTPTAAATTGGTPGSAEGGTGTATIVVHVLGAVAEPGLVELPGGSRVQDALDAAGGLTRKADPGDLNLAQPLLDGQQVVIGTKAEPAGEVRDAGAGPGTTGGSTGGPGDAPTGSGPPGTGGKLNLNSATAAQLEALPGIGPVTAGKIVTWREEHGRFSRVEELQEVSGIGPKTYAEIAAQVTAP